MVWIVGTGVPLGALRDGPGQHLATWEGLLRSRLRCARAIGAHHAAHRPDLRVRRLRRRPARPQPRRLPQVDRERVRGLGVPILSPVSRRRGRRPHARTPRRATHLPAGLWGRPRRAVARPFWRRRMETSSSRWSPRNVTGRSPGRRPRTPASGTAGPTSRCRRGARCRRRSVGGTDGARTGRSTGRAGARAGSARRS